MPLTQLSIEVPGLGDNSKNLEVEGAIAVGEKVAVSVSGLPADVSTSGSELRLRVLGPIGEDVATHGEWTYDAAKKTYATTLDLASVQAFRLFFPPPPPPRPHLYPRPPAPPTPLPPPGYDPVATAAAMQPPNAVAVRLVLELRDKDGSDSDADLLDSSLLGTATVKLNYWPADWQTATLIDLANGRVYSKEEVDAMIAEEARQRGVADAAEAAARIAGDAATLASANEHSDASVLAERNARIEADVALESAVQDVRQIADSKYAKPADGIPKSDLAASVRDTLDTADELATLAIYATVSTSPGRDPSVTLYRDGAQLPQNARISYSGTVLADTRDLGVKADLVDGKVPANQLPSYVDDVQEFDSVSAFPASGEKGKLYVARDTNKVYRWTGTQYTEISPSPDLSGLLPKSDVVNPANATSSGKAADALAVKTALVGKANSSHTHTTGDITDYVAPVQSDWNQTDSSAPDFIKNKPEHLQQTQADWSESDSDSDAFIRNKPSLAAVATTGDYADLTNKPTIPAAQVNSDWNAASGVAQILNKPSIPSAADFVAKTGSQTMEGPLTVSGDGYTSIDEYEVKVSNYEGTSQMTIYPGAISRKIGSHTSTIGIPIKNGTIATVEESGYAMNLAPAFSTSSTYAVGAYCTHEGLLYKCTTAVSTAGAWDAANWDAVAVTDEMGGGGGGLPYDAEVEYILATDGQYIDTGIASNTITAADGIVSTTSGTKSMFGARDGAGSNMLYLGYYSPSVNAFRLSYGSSTDGNKLSSSHLSGFVSLGWNQSTMWYGDNSTSVSLSGSVTSRNAYLFTFNNGGTPLTGETTTMAIRSFRIFGANGVLVRDYIAVRKNGVGCLYDRASGTFFYNAGSGAFAFGSDVANTNVNLLAYASTTTLVPETAVYRSSLNADGTFPTITDSAIPTAAAYYQFELELAVPSAVPSTITGPSGWTWIDGHGLPDPADLSGGETIYISVRLDCTARTFLASVWRVA